MRPRVIVIGIGVTAVGVLLAVTAGSLRADQDDRRLVREPTGGARKALVVGNAAYQGRPPLVNPVNDAQALARVLEEVGFAVTRVENAGRVELERAVDGFVGRIQPGDSALVFYAGHGFQLDGENYLVPVDFAATDRTEAKFQAYALGRVQGRLEERGARLVMLWLDACRDNPFEQARSGSGGWVAMTARPGSYIAFATAPGKTASDNRSGRNGLFTGALLEALAQPGLTLNDVFDRVGPAVQGASDGRQVPWVSSSAGTGASFVFRQDVAPAGETALRVELALWESIKDSRNPRVFEDYLRQYPAGRFRVAADDRLAELAGTRSAPAVSGPSPSALAAARQDVADARPRYEAAFSRYTRLVTTDERGDVEQALAEYKQATNVYNAANRRLEQLTRWRSPVDGREMAWIAPGTYRMGSPGSEVNREDEEVQHVVRITRGFWLDTTEVTNEAYQRFVLARTEWSAGRVDRRYEDGNYLKDWSGTEYPDGEGNQPVDYVSWYAARAYCAWAEKRLPTEAEWEYAARAGTQTAYWWGDEFDADRANNGQDPVEVGGAERTNPWGLADMLGNVWEWTASQCRPYPYRPDDGRDDVNADAACRSQRGGSWRIVPQYLRCAMRSSDPPATCGFGIGFRCAR